MKRLKKYKLVFNSTALWRHFSSDYPARIIRITGLFVGIFEKEKPNQTNNKTNLLGFKNMIFLNLALYKSPVYFH